MGEAEGGDAKEGTEPDQNSTDLHPSDGPEHGEKSAVPSVSITTALASAGHTLGGAEVEIVLTPLRLAFETKNVKILEPALDCLHVCNFLSMSYLLCIFEIHWLAASCYCLM